MKRITNAHALHKTEQERKLVYSVEVQIWKDKWRLPLWMLMIFFPLYVFSNPATIKWVMFFFGILILPWFILYFFQKRRKECEDWIHILQQEIEEGRGDEEFDPKKVQRLLVRYRSQKT